MKARGALVVSFAFLLCACAGEAVAPRTLSEPLNIEGIVISNHLAYTVRDVLVEVPATGRFAGCGNILPRTRCQTSFPAQQYGGHELRVSWTEHGEPQSTEPFSVKRPEGAGPQAPFWLEVEVFAPGQAGARLVQP